MRLDTIITPNPTTQPQLVQEFDLLNAAPEANNLPDSKVFKNLNVRDNSLVVDEGDSKVSCVQVSTKKPFVTKRIFQRDLDSGEEQLTKDYQRLSDMKRDAHNLQDEVNFKLAAISSLSEKITYWEVLINSQSRDLSLRRAEKRK